MTSRVSKNKEKKAKRKNSVKKRDQQKKQIVQRNRKNAASTGVEPGLSARASNCLTIAPH